MIGVTVLGSTGSIGRSTLSVVESFPEQYEAVALAAGVRVAAGSDAFVSGEMWVINPPWDSFTRIGP